MSEGAIKITYVREGRKGEAAVSIINEGDGQVLAVQRLDLMEPDARDTFVDALCEKYPGIDKEALSTELLKIADELVEQQAEGGERRESQADRLVNLAADMELFHTPGGHDSEAYASLELGGHRETWRITSDSFSRFLARKLHETEGKTPNSQALQDALNVITGKATFDGPERPVAVRLAHHDDAIWLDLADGEWRAVKITSEGWEIVPSTAVPVRFVRKRGMLPLPPPTPGGRVDELRSLVNLPGDDAWVLLVAWLVMALRPSGPYPVLTVNGEQGSAKSSLCRMVRALIDPNKAPLRRPPRADRDLMIAASNAWIIGYDNLSGLPNNLSDALCSLATGGGFATRELYSDGDEKLFQATRPIMLNGIEDIATRSDLMDRALHLTLPVISDDQRREEEELMPRFEKARPRILGALLDAVSGALREHDRTTLAMKPRMADFARWVTAAETALGWRPGTFMDAYLGNRESANGLAIESASIGPPIMALMDTLETWDGTAAELLKVIEEKHTDEKTRKRKDWPQTPKGMAGKLRRLAPNLRNMGIDATFSEPQGKKNLRIIRLERSCKQRIARIASVAESGNGGEHGDTSAIRGDTSEPCDESSQPVETQGGRTVASLANDGMHTDSRGAVVENEVMEWTG